jgi:hypothetical protein
MKIWRFTLLTLLVLVLVALSMGPSVIEAKGPGGGGATEVAGNNLSYPVIWAEGVAKTLPGTAGMAALLNGEWWYWWGTEGIDPNIVPLSCAPDPDDENLCNDGIPGMATGAVPGVGHEADLVKAYLQKDSANVWQAGTADWSATPVEVDWIDWGDNLESVDWYTSSQVRTEVVLFQDLETPMLEYQMRHTSGWGIDEVHGMAANLEGEPLFGEGTRATVYSNCARLTIQKLLVDRSDPALANALWVPKVGWTGAGLVGAPLFNDPVYEGGDGPGYYSAEINVKGRVIYGYTWNVRKLNAGPGYYRITFSFDELCGTVPLNTFFKEGVTQIMVPLEEEISQAAVVESLDSATLSELGGFLTSKGASNKTAPVVSAEEGSDSGGGTAVLDFANNLTYIDIRILERGGGGGGGKK